MGKVSIVFIFVVALTLALNNQNRAEAEKVAKPITDGEQYGVSIIYLKDGTKCAAMYSNGISCDWRGSKLERPNE